MKPAGPGSRRPRFGRRLRSVVIAAGAVAGVLGAAPLAAAASTPATSAATATSSVTAPWSATATPARIVVIAVPDLTWADLAVMPGLTAYAGSSAVAELSVRTLTSAARCADGSLTFSAATRAGANDEVAGCEMSPSELARLRAAAAHNAFRAHVGAFGQALHNDGMTTAAVGASAVPLLADRTGRVDVVANTLTEAVHRADVVAVVDDNIYYAPGDTRIGAAAIVDALISRQLAEIPAGVTVVVAGTSDGALSRGHLHLLLVHGPAWRHEALRSSSTPAPYVQLIDLGPTLLSMLHVPVPGDMAGSTAYLSGRAAGSPASYADDDTHAVSARDVGRRTRNLLGELGLLGVVLLGLGRWRPTVNPTATWFARVMIGVPLCSYLVQVLPWWRWGSWAYAGLVAAGSLLLAAAIALAGRRSRSAAFVVGPAVTAAALLVDQLAGAPLQLSAPLGDSPIVAGRFHGMGNIDFALVCASALLCAGVWAGRLRQAGRRRAAVAAATGVCLIAMVIDAAPTLGDDLGGLLTMVPVVALFVALIAGIRLTWQRVLMVLVGAAALAVGVAALDYSRPAAHQTHIGHFVGQILHGGAAPVVQRKLDASLMSFGNVAITGFVVAVVVAVVAGWVPVTAMLRRLPGLPEAAIAVAGLCVLGTFLNDSGVVIAQEALFIALFAIMAARLHVPVRPRAAAGDNGATEMRSASRSGGPS